MVEQTKSRQTTEVQHDFVELLGSRAWGSGGWSVAWPRSRLAAGRRRRDGPTCGGLYPRRVLQYMLVCEVHTDALTIQRAGVDLLPFACFSPPSI